MGILSVVGIDDTVLSAPAREASAPPPPAVEVTYPQAGGGWRTVTFSGPFCIGRHPDCQIRITDSRASRRHLDVFPEAGGWWVRDLKSTNGTFVDGRPIQQLAVGDGITLRIGSDGPDIRLRVAAPPPAPPPAGVQPRRRFRVLRWTLAGVLLALLLGGGATALHHYQQQRQARLEQAGTMALEMFYGMKTLELQIAALEERIDQTQRHAYLDDLLQRRRELAALREEYRSFVATLGLGRQPQNEEERLILRMAQNFGESDIAMPADFIDAVKDYIGRWQRTPRLARALRQLAASGHAPLIHRELAAHGLPPQFLYLALQESNFDARAVGPPTRYGFAKGMWQMIPDTGARYGLKIGARSDLPEYDPEDERHDVAKATRAATRYLRDIYRTDAQASGLLVMASYNWGEGNIVRLIRTLPANPRARNFWQLLKLHPIPQETYDYVLSIFSAAVIGENPGLFGFDFANPLHGLAPSAASQD